MNSFEFAINMELDGEKYYIEQAKINKENRKEQITEFYNHCSRRNRKKQIPGQIYVIKNFAFINRFKPVHKEKHSNKGNYKCTVSIVS